jgi:hypothetical protein
MLFVPTAQKTAAIPSKISQENTLSSSQGKDQYICTNLNRSVPQLG